MTSLLRLPPATFSEVAWDLLLALYGDRRGRLSLRRLSCLTSAPLSSVNQSLAELDKRRLVTVRPSGTGGQWRPMITLYGRDLLERYFSAASGLQSVDKRRPQRAGNR